MTTAVGSQFGSRELQVENSACLTNRRWVFLVCILRTVGRTVELGMPIAMRID
jgi:hypothetical protein